MCVRSSWNAAWTIAPRGAWVVPYVSNLEHESHSVILEGEGGGLHAFGAL
jgi:hypothetical protein